MGEVESTINLEPNWEGVRRWLVEAVYPFQPERARTIAALMGSEAPEFPEEDQ